MDAREKDLLSIEDITGGLVARQSQRPQTAPQILYKYKKVACAKGHEHEYQDNENLAVVLNENIIDAKACITCAHPDQAINNLRHICEAKFGIPFIFTPCRSTDISFILQSCSKDYKALHIIVYKNHAVMKRAGRDPEHIQLVFNERNKSLVHAAIELQKDKIDKALAQRMQAITAARSIPEHYLPYSREFYIRLAKQINIKRHTAGVHLNAIITNDDF